MFELILRVGFSLVIVGGLLWLLTRVLRGPGGRGGDALAVLARQQLTRGGAVAVVRVAGRTLVLGVTDQRVNLLAETDLDPAPPAAEPATPPTPTTGVAPRPRLAGSALAGSLLSPQTWRDTVEFLRERTVRKP